MVDQFLNYFLFFFRHSTDAASNISIFSKSHIIILVVAVLGIYFIIKEYYTKFNQRKLEKIVAYLMLAQQTIMYAWYIFEGNINYSEMLPLYNCRVAIICGIIGLLFNKNFFKLITIYWGIFGGALSLIVLSLEPFSLPHWTYFSYIGGHLLLLWTAVYFFKTAPESINAISLKAILIFTNIFNLFVMFVNHSIHANYSFLQNPPIDNFLNNLPGFTYSIIALIAFNLLIILIYYMLKKIPDINSKAKIIFNNNLI